MDEVLPKTIRAIITGATGMVGEGVLLEALENPVVEKVLIINRRPSPIKHPKLTELIHKDFFNLFSIQDQLEDYNACYFCLGVSSLGMTKEEYYRLTYTLTMNVAAVLSQLNPGMTFCYISGAGTDSTEKGKSNWARVKGKTENDLMKLPFKQVFALRPGFIKPIKGQNNAHGFYRYIMWLFPIGRKFYPKGFCTLQELAKTMFTLTTEGCDKQVIEGDDIIRLGS